MGLRNPLTNDRLRLNEKNIDQFADAGGIPVVIEACLGDMAFAEDHKWREGTLFFNPVHPLDGHQDERHQSQPDHVQLQRLPVAI